MRSLLIAIAMVFSLGAQAAQDIWVYTSIYKEFVTPIQKGFEAKNPGYKVQIFQSGSEKIQAKFEAEIAAQKPQADVLVISDPFYGANLEGRGLLEAPPRANYHSLMVMIVNKNVPAAARPQAFSDLTQPQFKNQVQMGSPLESGTVFATVGYLSEKYGWDFFDRLGKNALAANGGNSVAIQKVESGEKKIGVTLLENALAAIKKGSPIEIIYPTDGAVPVPSVQLILKSTKNKEGAKKFADFLLTKEAQKLLLNGFMYSVDKSLPPPEGAKSFAEVTKNSKAWTPEIIRKTGDAAKTIKAKFAELVLE